MRLERAITRPGSRFVTAIALMALAACGVDSPTSAPDVSGDPQFARGGQNLAPFIVVLHENARDVRGLANKLVGPHGRQPDLIYEHAIKGFAVWLPAQAARGLANHPSVAYVEEDREVSIAAQSVPTGIDRIFASSNTNIHINGSDDFRVDVDVAIIDTGIDWEHPDLNVVDGINCARRKGCKGNGDDDHYHGTHVAGTVAALDNDVGVVGVAPGARLHAVKVLDRRGSGYASWIVAGIDWVAARADVIEVANMSLGGSGYSNAEYQAIQNAVDLGVAFAVAAGNSAADSDGYSPAAFDNVLTVSALADFNGQPGGGAASPVAPTRTTPLRASVISEQPSTSSRPVCVSSPPTRLKRVDTEPSAEHPWRRRTLRVAWLSWRAAIGRQMQLGLKRSTAHSRARATTTGTTTTTGIPRRNPCST